MNIQAHNTITVRGHKVSIVWCGNTVEAFCDNKLQSAVTYHGVDAHNKCATLYANTVNHAFALRDKFGG